MTSKNRLHPKVKAGVNTAGYATLIAWVVSTYHLPVPPEAAVALAGLLTLVVQYLKPSDP